MAHRKLSERYEFSTEYAGKTVSIYLTVNLDNDHRTVDITGSHDKFEFRNSDPYLVKTINELIDEALDVAQNVQRVKSE